MITNISVRVDMNLESGTAKFLLDGQQERIDWHVDRYGEVVVAGLPEEWEHLIGKAIQDER